jgi:hypothetical protein
VRKRADTRRNERTLLDAAAAAFVESGTIYRHVPRHADLAIAVFCHQVEDCVEARSALCEHHSRYVALHMRVDAFVDCLVTTQIDPGVDAYGFLRAVGDLRSGADGDDR